MADIGRPSEFTQEIADKICAGLAEGKSLRTVCKPNEMPHISTIFNWFRNYPDFLEQYTRAKQESADAMADEVLDIADDGTNDWMTVHKYGGEYQVVDQEAVQRSKLRVETRKWLMAKMKPKKYGEKLDLTSDGKRIESTPVVISNIAPRNAESQTEPTESN